MPIIQINSEFSNIQPKDSLLYITLFVHALGKYMCGLK